MDLNEKLSISYYEEIGVIDASKKITLVKHQDNDGIFVKKILNTYNADVYKYLCNKRLSGFPHIYEVHEDNGKLIVIEEYITGQTLEQYIADQTDLSIIEIKNIIMSLCDSLCELHSMNPPIVHRDLKPSNIMIRPSGMPVILDFNASKFVSEEKRDTKLLGTEGYAAPEQYGFGSSDIRTDIYALGIIIKELLEKCSDRKNKIFKILDKAAQKCCELSPKSRFQNVGEILRFVDHKKTISIIWLIIAVLAIVLTLVFFLNLLRKDSNSKDSDLHSEITENHNEEAVTADFANAKTMEDEKQRPVIKDYGYSFYKRGKSNYLSCGFELYNPNDNYTIEYPEIDITVRDSDGNIIKTENFHMNQVLPEETIYYGNSIFLDSNAGSTVTIEADALDYNYVVYDGKGISVMDDLMIADISESKTSTDKRIYGTVTNNSDTDINTACVYAIYKIDGKICGGGSGYVDNLRSGATKTFKIIADNYLYYKEFEVFPGYWD